MVNEILKNFGLSMKLLEVAQFLKFIKMKLNQIKFHKTSLYIKALTTQQIKNKQNYIECIKYMYFY